MAKLEAISEKIVAALPAPETGNQLHYASGLSLQGKKAPSGFAVRVTSAGTKSFVWFHRVNGKPYWETLGRWDANAQGGTLTVRDAIIAADNRAKLVAKGIDTKGNKVDPRPERTRRREDANQPTERNISGLLDNFVTRYLKGGNLRTAGMIEAELERLVKPRIGKVGIYELRRSQVSRMLDEIADEHGPRMADLALAYTRKAFSWYEINGHDDDFKSPIVRGMARLKPSERQRERVLADDEIRDLWAALDTITEPACFPAYVKMMLLTGTRRSEVADMPAAELDGDLWIIPAARYKTKRDHVVPLSAMAREVLGAVTAPKQRKNDYFIFSTTKGAKAFSGFSKAKTALDEAIADIRKKEGRPPIEEFTFHDLRRTARTLMSRARVHPDHAERCLGHVISGVRGVYDRFEFLDEKREAFEALAALLSRILNPQANVADLAAHRAGVQP
ncbi:tyrosine-type recombinase/integrase [Bradyrhizobium cytisi]|uniref:tyrosine-type recombinase/integrase n=1 Tax=Bradyrhizobium cytisi TaxID=515489 RepID=UPI001FE53BE9|nr:site-specific integrase [Bradyrhizobium cytisi]